MIAKIFLRRDLLIEVVILVPMIPPKNPPNTYNKAIDIIKSPAKAYLSAVTMPNVPTARRDVPTALLIFVFEEYKIEGTIRNPPPIPKYPEAKPAIKLNTLTFFLFTFSFLDFLL